MSRTGFNHRIDGFSFNNRWTDSSPADLDQLSQEIANMTFAASFSPIFAPFTLLIPPGPPASNLILRQIVQGMVSNTREPAFGLCGGMAVAALDYYRLGWVPPRGTGSADHPTFATPEGAELRRYIWSRLIDTLQSDGLTCLLWMGIQFNIFPFSGGCPELLRRTRDEEWVKIKSHLDAGDPWPVGIIGETRDPMSNHQVLATGYDDAGDGHPTLYIMDSNAPDTETVLGLDFTGPQLVTVPAALSSDQGEIRGIYCESYTPKVPPFGVAVDSGLTVTPGSVPTGGAAELHYHVMNVGFGPSPALRLFGVGRDGATGANVNAGFDEASATSLAHGVGRDYDKVTTVAAPLGLRHYSVGVSVEQSGTQAWRSLPAVGSEIAETADLIVAGPAGPWVSLGGQLLAPPSAGTAADGRIVVVGLGLDSQLWRMEQTAPSNGWGDWVPCAAGCPALTGRAALAQNGDGRLEVFARGADGQIWHAFQNHPTIGTDWAAWSGLGDSFSGDPAVYANQDGRLEVFAVSTDGRLRHKWQYPFGWNGWADLGVDIVGRPDVGRHPDGRLEVFARHPDGTVFHAWQTSAGGNWASGEFGGVLTSDLTVGRNADGHMEVFARGTDGQMFHRWVTPDGWADWQVLPGGLFPAGSTPAVALDSVDQLSVFNLGMDSAVWSSSWPWAGFGGLGGGAIASDPVVVANADRRLELLALGLDRSLVHRWQTGVGQGWN